MFSLCSDFINTGCSSAPQAFEAHLDLTIVIHMSRSLPNLLSTYKREILDIYKCAIEAVKPETLIERAISFKDGQFIVREPNDTRTNIDLDRKSLHIIGGGKSTLAMARGLASIAVRDKVSHLFSNGCLSIPIDQAMQYDADKTDELLKLVKVQCLFGSKNNLPDEDSVRASKSILTAVSAACREDMQSGLRPLFIVLLSGGGSACLTSPRLLSLNEKLHLIKHLAQRGADIVELNTIRRCFSDMKGGQMAMHIYRQCSEAQIVTLVLSDIVGDPIEFIASGPTCLSSGGDLTQRRFELESILTKYRYPDKDTLVARFDNDPSSQDSENILRTTIQNKIIGNNLVALDAAIHRAKAYGYDVHTLGNRIQGQTQEVLRSILELTTSRQSSDKHYKTLIIGAGEATVSKQPEEKWGLGGRAQEMALDYIISRLRSGTIGDDLDLFLAASTDGQDGPTDVAACMASYSEIMGQGEVPFDLDEACRAKKSHDSYNFWQAHKPNWLVRSGLTGTNVMDLYMLVKIKE